ncbi:MAG: DUF5916 domain-containing protein [Pseudomonadota bacterium]
MNNLPGRVALIFLLLFPALGQGQDAAVIGSFADVANALALRDRAQQQLGDRFAVSVQAIPTGASRMQRVLVVPVRPAGDIVEIVRGAGFPGAWRLVLDDTAQSVGEPRSERPPAARPPPAPRDNLPVADRAPVPAPAAPAPPEPALPSTPTLLGDEPQLLGFQDGIPFHRIAIRNFGSGDPGIVLDGAVDEPIWDTVRPYDNMIVAVPAKGTAGEYSTAVRLLATDKGLYVSSVMEQPPETLVRRFSTRDDFIDRDTFGLTLDVSGQGLVGYWFIVALGGSVMDGKVLPERNYQRDWDGPWIGRSAVRPDGWSVEMFLPWSMMNMPDTGAVRNIGFAASRQISHSNERYQWPGYAYSSARFVSALNQADVEGVYPRQQFSIIPFASTTRDEARGLQDYRAGADISWKPSPKFELTASVLPDFGAVESDDVVLNLSASETFFPEKRLFFLEGNEIFDTSPRANTGNIYRIITNDDFNTTSRKISSGQYVPAPISLINSRRIGGSANQQTVPAGVTADAGENRRPTELLGAGKLTGSLGNLRYGLLGAEEDDVLWYGTDMAGNPVDINGEGRTFGVSRFLYESVGKGRSAIGFTGTAVQGPQYDAYVHAIDAHYTSREGKLIVDTQAISSDVDGTEGIGGLFDLMYAVNSNLRHKIELDYMDEGVHLNDLGFLRRNNYSSARYVLIYNKQKFSPSISNYRSTLVFEREQNVSKGQYTGGGVYWRTSMVLPGRNSLRTGVGYFPARYEDLDSRGNGAYRVEEGGWLSLVLATDAARVFSYSAGVGIETEDLGDLTYSAVAGVTIRPLDTISIDLDVAYKKHRGWLVYQGGRNFGSYEAAEWQPKLNINWFLAVNHQLRFSLQWVGVRADEAGFWEVPAGDGELMPGTRTRPDHDFTVSMVTAQLRYRWEIAPLTDFYLVFNLANTLPNQTGSHFPDLFSNSFDDPIINRFIMKLRYRFGN